VQIVSYSSGRKKNPNQLPPCSIHSQKTMSSRLLPSIRRIVSMTFRLILVPSPRLHLPPTLIVILSPNRLPPCSNPSSRPSADAIESALSDASAPPSSPTKGKKSRSCRQTKNMRGSITIP
jgi:hypothetical protein